METSFTRLVGCRVPIQQAPMGEISGPDLAVAVAQAGGVGTMVALAATPDALDAVLRDLTARTDGVVGINFLTESIDPESVQVAAGRVRLVDFFWRQPDAALVELAHRGGALASWQVGSADEAKAAGDAGCDIVAVQGTEAGGHIRGIQPLLEVLGQVLDAVAVPVLAAGGIADRASFARVMDAGAAGARIGTRFVATTESGAHPEYKQAIVDAGSGTTEITDQFADCPLCATSPRARVLRRAIDAKNATERDVVGEATIAGQRVPVTRGSGMPPTRAATGAIDAMAMYAGESVGAVDDIVPVAEVIERLCGGT
jgi:nitronate monooxygenase